jgi:hypothetical protein
MFGLASRLCGPSVIAPNQTSRRSTLSLRNQSFSSTPNTNNNGAQAAFKQHSKTAEEIAQAKADAEKIEEAEAAGIKLFLLLFFFM